MLIQQRTSLSLHSRIKVRGIRYRLICLVVSEHSRSVSRLVTSAINNRRPGSFKNSQAKDVEIGSTAGQESRARGRKLATPVTLIDALQSNRFRISFTRAP